MTRDPAIRWMQRFDNYRKAVKELADAVALREKRGLSKLEAQGLVQGFEYTYELGWKLLKDYLEYQGIADLTGSRDTIREAFSRELITDGQVWMDMLVDRNRTSHIYDEKTIRAIEDTIAGRYYPGLAALVRGMEVLEEREQ